MKDTFEDYLKDVHAENYTGTDDDMPDSFDTWLTELQVDTLIDWAQLFAEHQYQSGRIDSLKDSLEILKKN